MIGGPWPQIAVGGKLEAAEAEWLHTNGAGAYSMSTVAMMHTRRYHGLLVAALDPPHCPTSILSHAETTVTVKGKAYRLSTHQFPGVAPTPGYRLLETFAQDPLPRWSYRLGKGRLERVLCLVRGSNAVILAYTWQGKSPARLSLRPLLSLRDADGLVHEHGGMIQRVRLRPGVVESRPVETLPPVLIGHAGVFVGSPDWYRRFEYAQDKASGLEGEEDLWTPGTIELSLVQNETQHIVFAIQSLPEADPALLVHRTAQRLLDLDPGPERPELVRRLFVFGDAFRLDATPRPTVVAGYPWLGTRSREIVASIPGLYLARGDVDGARAVLRTAIGAVRDGLLPADLRTGAPNTPSVEASLGLFECARLLAREATPADAFLRGELYPVLHRFADRVRGSERAGVWLSPDGLLANGAAEDPPAFRDSQTGALFAPTRRALRVEQQAHWTRALETLASLADAYGEPVVSERARADLRRAREAFARRFWCEAEQFAFDSLTEAMAAPETCEITPNALVALALDPALFKRWQGMEILARVRRSLLVARGVRAREPDFRRPGSTSADAAGAEASAALPQTVAWPAHIAVFARAALGLSPDDFELQEALLQRVRQGARGGTVLGQISEYCEADEPFRPLGCPAAAQSAAELLRTLVWDLRV